jgi:hypothetical protein
VRIIARQTEFAQAHDLKNPTETFLADGEINWEMAAESDSTSAFRIFSVPSRADVRGEAHSVPQRMRGELRVAGQIRELFDLGRQDGGGDSRPYGWMRRIGSSNTQSYVSTLPARPIKSLSL